jgi:hypothetical protein
VPPGYRCRSIEYLNNSNNYEQRKINKILFYFQNNGFNWTHAGGTLGYESVYAYNPCTGIYLALAYNIKPKE